MDENKNIYKDFDKLFLTIPATQILEMDINLKEALVKELSKIKYDSIFSLILYSNELIKLNENKIYENKNVSNIVNNSKKYSYKDFSSYVIYSTKEFTNELNNLPKEEIYKIFLETFDEDLKNQIKDFNTIPHLWKFAFVRNSLDIPYFINQDKTLGICGDYFNFSNIEASLSSSELLGNLNF
jgi:predicted NAD/FAD-dependent oxidoreductase